MFSRLQYISQGNTAQEQRQNIQAALDAGCTWIQLRFKEQDQAVVRALAEAARKLCADYKAFFIVNDSALIAAETEAHGVHLGLQDMPVADARAIVGPTRLVGGTANTLADVRQRIAEGCDYIGLGPFRFTTTKARLSPILGLEGYASLLKTLREENATTPLYAIGGITLEDIPALRATGVYGVALSGAITQAHDKRKIVDQLKEILYATTTHSR
jgi:thiamine-phosphate pyrophosphorylase